MFYAQAGAGFEITRSHQFDKNGTTRSQTGTLIRLPWMKKQIERNSQPSRQLPAHEPITTPHNNIGRRSASIGPLGKTHPDRSLQWAKKCDTLPKIHNALGGGCGQRIWLNCGWLCCWADLAPNLCLAQCGGCLCVRSGLAHNQASVGKR